MEEEKYKLRCVLYGHTQDVRDVSPTYTPELGIVSCSRDSNLKIWTPNESDSKFTETVSFSVSSKYVSSVHVSPPSVDYPCGIIFAGSQDNIVYGFLPESSQPIIKHVGHEASVCCLSSLSTERIVSGSWDKTARVWQSGNSEYVLQGHLQCIWAVDVVPANGEYILTGSGDTTIKLWLDGVCITTFTGHDEAVRGVKAATPSTFYSCSNDGTVKYWNISGECLMTCSEHTDYIYSIALISETDFVTCSEDESVRIWRNKRCIQILNMPFKSPWNVTILKNEDIVIAGSDSTVRVYTKHPNLMASAEEVLEIERRVISTYGSHTLKGEITMTSIPGIEALEQPGKCDGDTVMIREGSNMFVMYSWSSLSNKWSKGDDSSNADTAKNKKIPFEGKNYDVVYTIDVDGTFYSLPYNYGEDPWAAAQAFITKHELNLAFLDQVAEFITVNSPKSHLTPRFHGVDPFTGDSRYIPNQVPSSPSAIEMSENPGSRNHEYSGIYYPVFSFIKFNNGNFEGIERKMNEFSKQLPPNLKLTKTEVKDLLLLTNFPKTVTDEQMANLDKIMSWPTENIFPCLDLFRLAVRSEIMDKKIQGVGIQIMMNHLIKFFRPEFSDTHRMLILRTFCNFFGLDTGTELLVKNTEKICNAAVSCLPSKNKAVETSVSTLLLNYAILFNPKTLSEIAFVVVSAIEALVKFHEPEAIFRVLVCLGTSMGNDIGKLVIQNSELGPLLPNFCKTEHPRKIFKCVDMLLKDLRNIGNNNK